MERITLLLCANMTGADKRKLLVIGKSKSVRCFKGNDLSKLPVIYKSNSVAWMTGDIFRAWLQSWDTELGLENRRICLLVDNATSHRNIPLNNIQLHFLPPNTTSLVQAMDQGIIRNFKHFYREQVRQRLVDALDAQIFSSETSAIDISRRISLLDAIIMALSSWESVKATTITNCFRKAVFLSVNVLTDHDEVLNNTRGDEEFVTFDDDETCQEEINPADVEDIVVAKVAAKRAKMDDADDNDEIECEPSMPKPSTLLLSLQDTQRFLLHHGKSEHLSSVDNLISVVRQIRDAELKQTDIRDFFSTV